MHFWRIDVGLPVHMRLPVLFSLLALASCAQFGTDNVDVAMCRFVPVDGTAMSPFGVEHPGAGRELEHSHLATHGQLVLGGSPSYLYHLPLFMNDPERHPHAFQIVLGVKFDKAGADELNTPHTPSANSFYTFVPEPFEQTDLIAFERLLPSLRGSLHRGHFERPPSDLLAQKTEAEIVDVKYFREFGAEDKHSESLRYILFGDKHQWFLAHKLSAPPDFDQILVAQAELPGDNSEILDGTAVIELPGRGNNPADRLRPGEELSCATDSSPYPTELRIRVGSEVYCEIGELAQYGFEPSRVCGAD